MDVLDNAFLTRTEAAFVLRVAESRLQSWIDSGAVVAARLPDGKVRIAREEVLRLLSPRPPTRVVPLRSLGGVRC